MLASVIGACSGYSSTPTTIVPSTSPSRTPASGASARVVITVPARSTASAKTRHPAYVSPSTQSITVQVDSATPTVQNLSPTSPDCSGTGANYPYTCTVPISATAGSHTFTFVTYDAMNAAGNELSANSVVQSISADQVTLIAITLAGVPVAVRVEPAPGANGITGNEQGLNFIGRQTQVLTVVPVDADGNDIVGPGEPTLAVSVTGATAGSGIAIAAVSGNTNDFTLTSRDPGTATLVVAETPASSLAGAGVNLSVPLSSLAAAGTLAGSSTTAGFVDGSGGSALFNQPGGVAYDSVNGDAYVVDSGNCAIRQITVAGAVTTIAGGGPSACGFADGTGTAAHFDAPVNVAYDTANGNLYVADRVNCSIRQVTPSGTVTTLAGSVAQPCTEINGMGSAARFEYPIGIGYDAANNMLYVADGGGCTLRAVTMAGVVTTIAGGTCGYADGNGAAAEFMNPGSVAYDAADGNLYVGDTDNCAIRKVTTAGVVTTFAGGGPNACGFVNGIGTAAAFGEGVPVVYSPLDNDLYVSDESNCVIRQITPAAAVTTIAGSIPVPSCSHADGWGTAAGFGLPGALAYDSANGSLIIVEADSAIGVAAGTVRMLQL